MSAFHRFNRRYHVKKEQDFRLEDILYNENEQYEKRESIRRRLFSIIIVIIIIIIIIIIIWKWLSRRRPYPLSVEKSASNEEYRWISWNRKRTSTEVGKVLKRTFIPWSKFCLLQLDIYVYTRRGIMPEHKSWKLKLELIIA